MQVNMLRELTFIIEKKVYTKSQFCKSEKWLFCKSSVWPKSGIGPIKMFSRSHMGHKSDAVLKKKKTKFFAWCSQ